VKVDALRGGQRLDRDDHGAVARHLIEPPCREGGHADVILLVRGGRQAVDARRMRQRLVLRSQRGGGHMRNHEPRVQARLGHQKRRQARQRRIDQQRDAPLCQSTDLGEHQRERVGRERDGFRVEIAAGQHGPASALIEQQRIVRHRVRFDREDAGGVAQLIEAGPHHLWLAAQRIRVLHAAVVGEMRTANLAAREQVAIACGRFDLPALAADFVNPRIERCVTAARSVHGQGPRHHGGGEHTLGHEESVQCECRGHLCAIDQREPFFRSQPQRRDAGGGERFRGGTFDARLTQRTLADQRQRQVGQRREISGGPDRAFAGHHRQQVRIEQRQQRVDDHRAHAGIPARETRNFHRQHEARHTIGERRSNADGVRADQVQLQLLQVGGRNLRAGEFAEPRVDAIGGKATRDDRIDRLSRCANRGRCARGQRRLHRSAPEPAQILQAQRARSQCQCRH